MNNINCKNIYMAVKNSSFMKAVFDKVHINLNKGDKIAIISKNSRAISAFYQIITDNEKADAGKFSWGYRFTSY